MSIVEKQQPIEFTYQDDQSRSFRIKYYEQAGRASGGEGGLKYVEIEDKAYPVELLVEIVEKVFICLT